MIDGARVAAEVAAEVAATYGVWQDDLVEKTTLYLTDELQRDMRALARRTGRPQADLIREALTQYLARQHGPPLPSFVGAVAVGGNAGLDKRRYRQEWIHELDMKHPR